ncbi:MAG: TIGR01620 family protein [Pseudomonadota bacterium]
MSDKPRRGPVIIDPAQTAEPSGTSRIETSTNSGTKTHTDPRAGGTARPDEAPASRSVLLDGDGLDAAAHTPETAPPVPEPDGAAPPPDPSALSRAFAFSARRTGLLGRIFWASAAGFVSLIAGVILWDFVAGLLARSAVLGGIAVVLGTILLIGALSVLIGEFAALSRLRRIDRLQIQVRAARADGGLEAARACADALTAFYAERRELAWGRDALRAQRADLLDGDALLDEFERKLIGPLDTAAQQEIEAAARQVAVVTAMVPLALADVVTALLSNLRMIRRIAAVYGGRAGGLGSWRLVRAVSAHLVATGALAMGDDMIGAALGGGILSRLSRRVGEGVVNGGLTVRVGLAAMEVCRPMDHHAVPAPATVGVLRRALAGVVARG